MNIFQVQEWYVHFQEISFVSTADEFPYFSLIYIKTRTSKQKQGYIVRVISHNAPRPDKNAAVEYPQTC
jgi:hypothetical protein